MCSARNDKPLTDADLLSAAGRLPERQRLAFFLVVVRGLSVRKAAKAMGGISEVAVAKNLKRARSNLLCLLVNELPDDQRAHIIEIIGA